ncbi:MAG: DNA polymerase III subunit chi [Acidovorax sp.]
MRDIEFHFNAPDKLHYACRFTRKALRSDRRVLIVGPLPALQTLDTMLWNMTPQDFVAHALQGCDAALWDASPVVLAPHTRGAPHEDVLLNLGAEVPEGFERFARVVEVVSATDEADRLQARTRWRQYQAQGCSNQRVDLVLKY